MNQELEYWPLDKFIEYARNPRKNDHAVDKIAAAIHEFGFRVPMLAKSDGLIVDGHLRLKAARKLGLESVPVMLADDMTDVQIKAFRLSVNKMAELADWDDELLALELTELGDLGFDLDLTGFTLDEIAALTPEIIPEGLTDEDAVPEVPGVPVTVLGDVWLCGSHRVMCGDSTSIDAVERLMDGQKAQLLHADPPYGMGKENDGVQNDNIYGDNLDAFQMNWWTTFRCVLENNASAYIWGNSEGLWRLWYVGGLKASERITFRNEIAWDKGGAQGMRSNTNRMFPTTSERCIFFMLGEQGFNNNADNYWEGWEPIRSYLETEMNKCGGQKKWKAALSNRMGTHYFTKSQWQFPTKEAYEKLQAFAKGNGFKRDYDELKRDHDDLKRDHDELKREFYGTRAYFDNLHDSMTDVWQFGRVTGEERHGHATPKPVAMMARIMESSLPPGGLCVEPFGGSGSTLMGAEKTGRICYTMELTPAYVDVICKRWMAFTGKQATLESDGRTFAEASDGR
jgi:DNA modification methylase